MPNWFIALPIESTMVLMVVYSITAALLVALLTPRLGVKARRPRRWWLILALAVVLGGLMGYLMVVVLDTTDAFGVALSDVVHGAGVLLLGGLALVIVNLVRTRWWRRTVAVLALLGVVASTGLIVNEDFAYFPRLGDALGLTDVPLLKIAGTADTHDVPLARWRAPADLPADGTIGSVMIPGTTSGFTARPALVYLPPAARVAHPPRLPVVIALSGQPGTPSDVFVPGHLESTMDEIARTHHGVAPIVVAPDQLGSLTANPMCVNSRLGNVATYLTVDVRDWILRHLPVALTRQEWTIAGFSEGGTCAVQLGASYPAVFGSFVDVSGELAPSDGSVASTIATGFHGDAGAYRRATPLGILHDRRHYPDTRAFYAVGADDSHYAPVLPVLAAASRRAGMVVSTWTIPGYSHDWHTATVGLAWGMRGLLTWWGIDR